MSKATAEQIDVMTAKFREDQIELARMASHGLADPDRAVELFDRWLSAVRVRAWQAGYEAGQGDFGASLRAGMPISTPNPYQEVPDE